jgi:hypothetical protein
MKSYGSGTRRLRLAIALLASVITASGQAHEAAHGTPASPPPRALPGAEKFWTDLPVIVPAGPRAERGKISLRAHNLRAAELLVFAPDGPPAPTQVQATDSRWVVGPSSPDKGGHHWLTARETTPTEVITASTAWTFPSKGDAPTKMLKQDKGGLEIVPALLPEHGGMREGEDWEFHVRFDGTPLKGISVVLETESGTRSKAVTDARGVVRFAFPRDIDPASIDPKNGATRTRKGFVLAAEHVHENLRHRTAFNFAYYPDLMRERSLSGGIGFLALGMLLGLPLLRRKEAEHA